MAEKNRTTTSQESKRDKSERGNGFGQPLFGAKIFEDALTSYEQALKAGLRLQEESAKLWSSFLNEAKLPNYWQRSTGMFNDTSFSSAQRKVMEEGMQVMEQNSRRSLELLKRAGDLGSSLGSSEVQEKLQDLWEESLQILRSNSAAVVELNNRALDTWMELLRHQAEQAQERVAS